MGETTHRNRGHWRGYFASGYVFIARWGHYQHLHHPHPSAPTPQRESWLCLGLAVLPTEKVPNACGGGLNGEREIWVQFHLSQWGRWGMQGIGEGALLLLLFFPLQLVKDLRGYF